MGLSRRNNSFCIYIKYSPHTCAYLCNWKILHIKIYTLIPGAESKGNSRICLYPFSLRCSSGRRLVWNEISQNYVRNKDLYVCT